MQDDTLNERDWKVLRLLEERGRVQLTWDDRIRLKKLGYVQGNAMLCWLTRKGIQAVQEAA